MQAKRSLRKNLKSSKMKRTLLILGLAVIGVTIIFAACSKDVDTNNGNETENKWIQKANYQGAYFTGDVVFSINGKIYTGITSPISKELWEYDPATNKWAEKKIFPGNANIYTCFVAGNSAYILDGEFDYGSIKWIYKTWEYNPITDNWVQKANSPISTPNYQSCFSFGINNKGYVGSISGTFYEYNPETNSWKECANSGTYSNTEHGGMAVTSTEQNGCIIGGTIYRYISGNIHTWNTGSVYMYNPITDKWTGKAEFPMAIERGMAFCRNGVIYAGLGYADNNVINNKIYKYDSENNSWSFAMEVSGKRQPAFIIMCNGKLYVGGLNGNVDFWEYGF